VRLEITESADLRSPCFFLLLTVAFSIHSLVLAHLFDCFTSLPDFENNLRCKLPWVYSSGCFFGVYLFPGIPPLVETLLHSPPTLLSSMQGSTFSSVFPPSRGVFWHPGYTEGDLGVSPDFLPKLGVPPQRVVSPVISPYLYRPKSFSFPAPLSTPNRGQIHFTSGNIDVHTFTMRNT